MRLRHFPNNSMILSREIGYFEAPVTQDPFNFDKKVA